MFYGFKFVEEMVFCCTFTPFSNPKAADLLPITVQVIKDIEQFGLFVDVIVSDNYPLNVNLFKLLGNNKELLSCVLHPNDNQRSLYFMFDFVHMLRQSEITGLIKKILTVHICFQTLKISRNPTIQ